MRSDRAIVDEDDELIGDQIVDLAEEEEEDDFEDDDDDIDDDEE